MTTRIKAVLFDKDGTLIDFQRTWGPTFYTLIAQLADGDDGIMDRLAEVSGYHLHEQRFAPDSIMVAGSNDDVADAYAEILGLTDPAELAADINARIGDMSLPHITPFDDLMPVLDALTALGLALGIATNDAEASAKAQLSALGIDARFTQIIGFDSGYGAKPDPGMILGFCREADLEPSAVVMVGDSLHDLHAGRAAGVRTLGVTTGTVGHEVLAPYADHVATSLTQALDWITVNAAA